MLLFPYGTDGFHLDIPTDVKAKSVRKWNSSSENISALIRRVSSTDAVLANDGDRAVGTGQFMHNL